MRYTVTLKIKAKEGSVYWGPRVDIDASDDFDAVQRVIKLHEAEYGSVVLDYKVFLYRSTDDDPKHYSADIERWGLEDEIKEAPAKIARALDSIAYHIAEIEAKRSSGNVLSWAVRISLIISLITMLLLMLRV